MQSSFDEALAQRWQIIPAEKMEIKRSTPV
jgi:hypothetical protein